MKPAPFAYLVPRSLAECLEALGDTALDSRILAGGQSLVPLLNLRLVRPDVVVDINHVAELNEYRVDPGGLAIGAGVRMAELERDPMVAAACPPLAGALHLVGHPAIRSRGTVCGSLAHADPAAELPAVALALGATLKVVAARAERTVAAADFVTGPLTTALRPGDLVSEVRFPAWPTGCGWGLHEFSRRHGDFAICGAVVTLRIEGRHLADAAVAVFGVAGAPARLRGLEAELTGSLPGPEMAERTVRRVLDLVEPWDDGVASGWYRRRLASTLVGRAVADAITMIGRQPA